jgi:DNA-binding CsgD family transcriptional regulator
MTHLPDDPSDFDPSAQVPLLALGLGLIAAAGIADLVLDGPEAWLTLHGVVELTVVALSIAAALWLWRGWRRTSRALARTAQSLSARSEERDAWRAQAERARLAFGEAVDAQFSAWALSPAEREVALLMLQGHGHKEIAYRTSRSERTVRQHAVAVYAKSRLQGRAELAAFFLGDLLGPSARSDSAP